MDSSSDETKIIIPEGCGNAPRKQIVIDFTVAVLKQRIEIIKQYSDESITWYQLKDKQKIEGRGSLIAALQNENRAGIDCIEIYQVITHGKFASINGLISLTDDTKIDFCEVYVFSSTAKSGKIREIKSYRLESLN
ncbi:hypothetical protein [Marinococcus halophilus]|uniref:hypothetical protein n=1 Tax=Marinococcus halophilus TaxID=1371 RepID=UPI0009A738AB|nr:hypothetical protein [Marinococcus halophilus]